MNMASEQHGKMIETLAELRASHAAQGRAISALEQAVQCTLEHGINNLPQTTAPISEHRREHRPGPPPKIAGDPELQAFIMARTDRLTFIQIAAEIAQHFPANRRVGKTVIHEWWRKAHGNKRRAKP